VGRVIDGDARNLPDRPVAVEIAATDPHKSTDFPMILQEHVGIY
jgi:hypothetical protein